MGHVLRPVTNPDLICTPYVLYGVTYIDLVSLGIPCDVSGPGPQLLPGAGDAHLGLIRRPYGLPGVECMDLV